MLYNPPNGAATVNDSYAGKNVAAGQLGSKVPRLAVEGPQREIVNMLLAAGLSPTNSDFTQLVQAMSIGLWLGTFGGTANALTATLPVLALTSDGVTKFKVPALVPGMRFHGIIGPNANTGAVTLAIAGFATAPGPQPAVKADGASALGSGDLKPVGLATWVWDGTSFRLTGLVQSDVLALIAANGAVIRVTDTAAASTANALVGTGAPAISAYTPGQIFIFTTAYAITATNPTLNVTGAGGTALGAKTIVRRDGSALVAGPSPDIPAGVQLLLALDAAGANFRMLGLAPSDILSLAPLNRVAFPSSTSATLTPAAKGSYNYGYVNSPTTYTLPECTAFGIGYIGFLNNNNQGITVNAATGAANTNQIVFGNNQNATQAVLSKTKAWLVLFCDGNNWTILSADPSINAKIGTNRTASQGYEIQDNGTIRQWGTITSTGGNDNTYSFPTAFPNGCDHVDINPAPGAMTANYSLSYLADSYTKTGFTLRPRYNSNGTTGVASNSFTFEARGY